ncbi:MAG: ABC-type transport auxiliary lipoprotein family protein, partial [Pseudomonadota bacterium]
AYYALNGLQLEAQADNKANATNSLPTLIVNTPKAAAGFDTRHIIYTRSPHQLEYFARNEWVDTPSNMLQPLMVAAIEHTQAFNAVVPKLAAVKTDLRLETEMLSLVQDFNSKPSAVRFALRATIIDSNGKIVALREFATQVQSNSDNPIGGVKAANQAVNIVLKQLADFCAETAKNWKPSDK